MAANKGLNSFRLDTPDLVQKQVLRLEVDAKRLIQKRLWTALNHAVTN